MDSLKMSKQRIFLLATGCFNPPTIMHLRIMELARDHLNKLGFKVVGGAITPVHDGYGKKGLLPAVHRLQMTKLALKTNDWVKVSEWEATRESWTRTRFVIDHHQTVLDEFVKGEGEGEDWLPDKSILEGDSKSPIQLKIVCGADLLDSFNVKDLWANEDVIHLTRDHGFVVITREGNDPLKSIYNNDILHAYQEQIHIVHEWITNDISSTKVRLALRRSDSVRYVVPDLVLEYIKANRLYECES